MKYIIAIIVGYLLGSINNSYLLGKAKGIDIRTVNSHNPGAANAQLTFGWKAFFFVWIMDMLKTCASYYLINYFYHNEILAVIAACASIVGHCFSIFLGFKGGKGFSCYCGLGLALNPIVFLVLFAVAAVVAFTSMSLTFLTYFTLIIAPIAFWIVKAPIYVLIGVIISSIIVGVCHKKLLISFIHNEGLSIDGKKDGIRYVFKRHRDEN